MQVHYLLFFYLYCWCDFETCYCTSGESNVIMNMVNRFISSFSKINFVIWKTTERSFSGSIPQSDRQSSYVFVTCRTHPFVENIISTHLVWKLLCVNEEPEMKWRWNNSQFRLILFTPDPLFVQYKMQKLFWWSCASLQFYLQRWMV